MVAQPLPAIIACFVDDDGQSTDPDRPEAIKRKVDQRAAGNRNHRLADAIAVGPQARSMSSGDDAALDRRTARGAGHGRTFMRSRRSVTACSTRGSAEA